MDVFHMCHKWLDLYNPVRIKSNLHLTRSKSNSVSIITTGNLSVQSCIQRFLKCRAYINGILSIAMQWKLETGVQWVRVHGFTAFDLFKFLWTSVNLERVEPVYTNLNLNWHLAFGASSTDDIAYSVVNLAL